ncbi:response regulator transcription factor [Butyricicoccus sp.]|uniref:response regulator transcription factor n=1 Tax=Butyricicoccus sp. TaxID=2049021 RepID=UPI003F150032
MMLQAMIVDDEKMICQLILRLIDWDAMDIKVVGIAHDGPSALSLAQETKPDIIITDIRIPVFDGLELIHKLQQLHFQTRFIVISGYRYFEYARSALRYGVTEYLLKPINANELQQALCKLRAEIDAERQLQESNAALKKNLSAAGSRIRQQFLSNLIAGKIDHSQLSIDYMNRNYDFSIHNGPISLFIIKLCCSNIKQEYDLMPLVFSRVEPIVLSALQPHCSTLEIQIIHSRLYCLYQRKNMEVNLNITGIYERITAQFDDILNAFESFSMTLCPGEDAVSPAFLPHAIETAQHAVYLRLQNVQKRIVPPAQTQVLHQIQLDTVFSQAQQSVFCTTLLSGEKELISAGIQQIFKPFQRISSSPYDPKILFELCERIIYLSQNTLEPLHLSINFTQVMRAADHAESLSSVMDRFVAAFLDALEPYFALSAKNTGAPIQQAMRYIEQCFAEPLTLNRVAEQIGLSPAYLSSLFKKESGNSFNEYLTMCRMNAAKKLLRETSDPISLIAEQTGYVDAKYFSKVFSKTFGISPQKYRSL